MEPAPEANLIVVAQPADLLLRVCLEKTGSQDALNLAEPVVFVA